MKSKTFRTFTIVIAVLGVIGGMILGSMIPEVEISWSGRTQEHFNAALMLETWIGTALYVIPCFALSSLLENQEDAYQKLSKIQGLILSSSESTTNLHPVDKFIKSPNKSKEDLQNEPSENEWKCVACGECNSNMYTYCQICGAHKPVANALEKDGEVSLNTQNDKEWKCGKCSTTNPATYSFCKNCGNQKNKINNT